MPLELLLLLLLLPLLLFRLLFRLPLLLLLAMKPGIAFDDVDCGNNEN